MTAPANQTAPAQTTTREKSKSEFEMLLEKDVKTQVWFEPYGSNDEIKLSVPLIRRYIAVPAKDKESGQEIQPSDEECVKFLMLCKARRLNPFEGDAFMIPFWDGRLRRHAWSLITAHSAFLKRAELHPKYDGMDSGVIVQDKAGNILERQGDFRLNDDILLGGWATVFHKDKSHPKVSKVKLSTYKKEFGVWMNDPEGMICKVAEAQAVRDSFPTMIGGMFLREEMGATDDTQGKPEEVKRPVFNDNATSPVTTEPEKPKRGKRPAMVEEPIDPPKPVAQEPPANPTAAPAAIDSPAVPPVSTPTLTTPPVAEKPEDTLLRLCAADGISQEHFFNFLRVEKWFKKDQTKLTEMSTMKLNSLVGIWPQLVSRIKKANEGK